MIDHNCRASDDIVAVARMCAAAGIPHLINNAYGIQSASICQQITNAWRKGRVHLCGSIFLLYHFLLNHFLQYFHLPFLCFLNTK